MGKIDTLHRELLSSVDDSYPIGLAQGKMGLCIYFYYLWRYEENGEFNLWLSKDFNSFLMEKDKVPNDIFKVMNLNAAGIDIASGMHYVAVPTGRDSQDVRKSGMLIIESILGGERDAVGLAKLADIRVKASREDIVKSLQGIWRDYNLFELRQAHELYLVFRSKISDCDVQIEKVNFNPLPLEEYSKYFKERKIRHISKQADLYGFKLVPVGFVS